MNLKDQIEKHEKAIKILLLIGECERLIENNSDYLKGRRGLGYEWNKSRKEINEQIKARLERYYNSIHHLKLIKLGWQENQNTMKQQRL